MIAFDYELLVKRTEGTNKENVNGELKKLELEKSLAIQLTLETGFLNSILCIDFFLSFMYITHMQGIRVQPWSL